MLLLFHGPRISCRLHRHHEIGPALAKALIEVVNQIRNKQVCSTMTQLLHNFSDFISRHRRNHVTRSGSVVVEFFEAPLYFVAEISVIRFFASDDHIRTGNRQFRVRRSSRVVDNLSVNSQI